MTILSVKGVGKAYRFYESEWQRLAGWFGIKSQSREALWVLRDINFDIHAGEAVGIVGKNGAGKSTLLKMIVGTVKPSTGLVQISGRVAAILELGMGFNPELTGRQNAHYAAGLMGFSSNEIDRAMPDIEAFAEIGDYFDEPVRVYSSGMQVRVAFSVATAFRPDVLIVDEALSVGDAYFQHKCFDRIRSFQAKGTTLLLVSHDRSAIQALCDRALLLESGSLLKDGDPEAVLNFYNATIPKHESRSEQPLRVLDENLETTSGTGAARVQSISLLDKDGNAVDCINVGDIVNLEMSVTAYVHLSELVLGYSIRDRLGQEIYGTNTRHLGVSIPDVAPQQNFKVRFAFCASMGIGSYSVSTALHTGFTHLEANYEWKNLALVFKVVNQREKYFIGLNWMPPEVDVTI